MIDEVFDNLRKATDGTIEFQQELFRRWSFPWPNTAPAPSDWAEDVLKFQKKWNETMVELLKKHHESLESQFQTGLGHIEDACALPAAKDPAEFRSKLVELWTKSFECLRAVSETQMKDFQTAMSKCAAMVAPNGS